MSAYFDIDEESDSSLRFHTEFSVGDHEDLDKYEPGGFHPVHIGDVYDAGRYEVVHKLGFGGFSTVWLAKDHDSSRWVALKFVTAKHSPDVEKKNQLTRQAASKAGALEHILVDQDRFFFEGPNGRHLCLVLPVLGPSASQLSEGFQSRLRPRLARSAGYGAALCLSNLHSKGVCHGDVTTANILFDLVDLDQYGDGDLQRLFGPVETTPLLTEDEEPPGPEAPRYIVKMLDFLCATENLIQDSVKLVDFDQSFEASSPPQGMLGTPAEFLAPEVAAGHKASPASDVWALGCCLFRLRSGEGPFSAYEVNCPVELLRIVIQTLGDMPLSWQGTLFDFFGHPTKDSTKGILLNNLPGERSLRDLVYGIWDQPDGGVLVTGATRPPHEVWDEQDIMPYHACFSKMAWKPTATKIDNVFLYGYDDESEDLLRDMPKILEQEAALLYDLLSRIFVYDSEKRPSVAEVLEHPWFKLDNPVSQV